MDAYTLSLAAYNATLIPVLFFSVLFLLLALTSIFLYKGKSPVKKLKEFPFVSVQIPSYNDPIAARCIEQCIAFDYPKDKFEIIIADDSTNEETQRILQRYSELHPGFITYVHRKHREGFKAGALRDAMKYTKGEIIVIFDADWIPHKDFLQHVIPQFADPKVAIVQTRQGFYNHRTNIITRFAAYILMIYHTIVMPLNNRINCVFFCGTAGALRRKAFEDVGGWNTQSVTEDSELSVRLLSRGYKSVYVDYETPSEVPDTFESFIKQQMRWCYGNARVFIDQMAQILFKKGLTLQQRLMIIFITLFNGLSASIVVLMTLFGMSGWLLGEPQLVTLTDIMIMISRFLISGGFLLAGIITLYKRDSIKEIGHFVLSTLTMGLVMAFSSMVAFSKAVTNQRLHWFCTPKVANDAALHHES